MRTELVWVVDSAVPAHSYNGRTGKDALTLLREQLLHKGLRVRTRLSSHGRYVTSIGGVQNNRMGTKGGWIYQVDGEIPDVSPDEYITDSSQHIEWKYVVAKNV